MNHGKPTRSFFFFFQIVFCLISCEVSGDESCCCALRTVLYGIVFTKMCTPNIYIYVCILCKI